MAYRGAQFFVARKTTRAQPSGLVMFSAEGTQRRGRAKAKDAAGRRPKVDFELRWRMRER